MFLPLTAHFCPLHVGGVPHYYNFNRITLSHSTHRSFQVSPWNAEFQEFPQMDGWERYISHVEESESRMHKPIKYVEKAVTVAATGPGQSLNA